MSNAPTYQAKTIQNLKPQWYRALTSKEKLKLQQELKEQRELEWNNKPAPLNRGFVLVCKNTTGTLTKEKKYSVINYFATLVTTIYSSEWREFVTVRNDFGYKIKVSLNTFHNRDYLTRNF